MTDTTPEPVDLRIRSFSMVVQTEEGIDIEYYATSGVAGAISMDSIIFEHRNPKLFIELMVDATKVETRFASKWIRLFYLGKIFLETSKSVLGVLIGREIHS